MIFSTFRTLAVATPLILIGLLAASVAPVRAGKDEAVPEVRFADLGLAPDFEPVQWHKATVPARGPRHFGHDLYHLTKRLPLEMTVDEAPRPFRLEDGHRLVIEDAGARLDYFALSGAWRLHDRAAEASFSKASMTPEEAAQAVREALAEIVDLSDREVVGVAANTLTEELEDGDVGVERVLSYSVFLEVTRDGLQVVGGGAASAGVVTGSAEEPLILSLSHAPGDLGTAAGKTLHRTAGELIDEATARQRLFSGDVVLGDTPPDSVSAGTVTRVARAWFADGRFLHAEAIPIYVYQVLFKPLAGDPFIHSYFVSALSPGGWGALGYSEEQVEQDSRARPTVAGHDAVPNPRVWRADEDFPFASPAERQAVLDFQSAHCLPRWRSGAATWEMRPGCFNFCGDRAAVCANMGPDPDREYAISVRWAGLTASHIPDIPGIAPLPASYRDAWVDRVRTGFEDACWQPNPGYGTNGYVAGPFRPDVVSAADDGVFYFHMSHGWGSEVVECPGVKKLYTNIEPMGISLEPVFPVIHNFTSCGIKPDWSGRRLRYFFTMSSFGNAGRRQWTRVVGGGQDNSKVVIGHVSHGNRFYFSPWAPDPNSPTADPDAYPNMIANFFRNLAQVDASDLFGCRPDGMSFRVAMREAVIGTGTSQTDYHWGGPAHRNHPMAMRLVFSTEDQALDEHLPGWGPQYPNDGNYTGWAYLAQGSQWTP